MSTDEVPQDAPGVGNPARGRTRSRGMFSNARAAGSIAGVPVRLHASLLLLGILVVVTYVGRFAEDHGLPVAAAMAVAAAVLFVCSVLGHELAHALEGQHRGVHVRSITLFALGGVTEMVLDTREAKDEFAISAVGPWASLVIAAVLGLVTEAATLLELGAVADVTGLIAWTNVALAVFNLVPGSPLDGGRVLRSIVWAMTGSRGVATTVAARTGQLLGLALALFGLTQVARGVGVLGPLWLVVLGAFIVHGATREHAASRTEERLGERTAGDLATPVHAVPGDTPVSQVVGTTAELHADELVAVHGAGGTAVVTVAALRALDPTDAEHRTVGELAAPVTPPRVPAAASARSLAVAVDEHGYALVDPSTADAPGAPGGDGTDDRAAGPGPVLVSRRGVDVALRALLDGDGGQG